MQTRSVIGAALLALSTLLLPIPSFADGLKPVSSRTWNQAAVRKVLHTFAYGGYASDEQVAIWARMKPQAAIREILTFDEFNPKLSPIQDSTADFGRSGRLIMMIISPVPAIRPASHLHAPEITGMWCSPTPVCRIPGLPRSISAA